MKNDNLKYDRKIEKLNWRIAKLEHKITKQELILSNMRLYGKVPPSFYITNLVHWQNKRRQLKNLKTFYAQERGI